MSRKVRKKKRSSQRHQPDKFILLLIIIMAIFGSLMIFDASVYNANQNFNDQFYFLKLQLFWIFLGSVAGYFLYIVNYKTLLKLSPGFLIFTAVLLVLVLITGEVTNGSRRWFEIGPLPRIQPAEFAKLAVVMYFASWLTKTESTYKNLEDAFKSGFLKTFLTFSFVLGSIALLILVEPDLGTTFIICLTAAIMFFLSGKDSVHTKASALALAVVSIPLGIIAAILEPYRISRIQTYLSLLLKGEVADPQGSGYQLQQILIGIGSGGIWGKGFAQSRQRFGYLVENTAFTDSTFAIVLEELGLWGGAIIILAWVLFLWRGFKIAKNSPDEKGRLLAIGITVWLTCQAFLNMSANVGLIPLTGIPLPFLTYGGSSTIVTVAALGLLLNVSRYTKDA
jgi:cell division protein FtsW